MASPKRILVLHASCGAGHARAAQAVEKALKTIVPAGGEAADVLVVDTLDCASERFKRIYNGSYEWSVREAPSFFGLAFRLTSAAVRVPPIRALRRTFNRYVASKLGPVVRTFDPDVVICTHFLPLDFLARWKAKGRLRAKLACVVTDYVSHGFWADARCDRYYAPCEPVARDLVRRGVAPGRIMVTGIPVDAAFAAAPARDEARRALGLGEPGRRVVLVLGGGLGMGPVAEVVRSIATEAAAPGATKVEIVAVCGKNTALKAELDAIAPHLPVPVRVLGFARNVPELMAAADIVVTKPGGLTTTEALAIGRPLVLFTAMPGQEAGNAEYLGRAGAAIEAEVRGEDGGRIARGEALEIGAAVRTLLAEPWRLEVLASRARVLSRPLAARTIALDVLVQAGLALPAPDAPTARAA